MAHDKSHTMDLKGLALQVDAIVDANGVETNLAGITTIGALTVLTDSTGGTATNTLAAITAGGSYAQADLTAIKNAIASLAAKLNAIINAI